MSGGGLGGGHVEGIEVGPLLAIDLDRDEGPIDELGDVRILEGLVGHHMAPVAGGVADRDQEGLVLGRSKRQRLGVPWLPRHRIGGVLEQVGAGLIGKPVLDHQASVAMRGFTASRSLDATSARVAG